MLLSLVPDTQWVAPAHPKSRLPFIAALPVVGQVAPAKWLLRVETQWMPLLAFLFLQWCFIYCSYVAQKFNRIVYFSLWQFFSCLVCRYKVKSVFGCWYCKNQRLSFILFYSCPISAFKVNLRPFGSMSLLPSYKNKFTSPCSLALRCWGWDSPADLLTYVTLGWSLHLPHLGLGGRMALAISSSGSPAVVSLLILCSHLAFHLIWHTPFVGPWGSERKLSSWASENPRYKLFLFLWALWPWICAVARNMYSHLASSIRDVHSVPAVAPFLPKAPQQVYTVA